ncbi:substrate-binding domain-containing protein, partial [Pseudanabaenaceae cyanobacterium LEGE 13415]|nr:substrate-binding domain-containing protein [Pseudanabaenaceae cyanobacterium LEGE 13415]
MSADPFSSTYDRCLYNAPLRCDHPHQTAQQFPNAKFCLECGFPAALSEQSEIVGERGTYRIVGFVRSQGMGRLYKGIRINDGQRVVITEYVLPDRAFNAQEAQQRKATFTWVAKVSWNETEGRDFRLVFPLEAIADDKSNRCYLISAGKVAVSPTLEQFLKQNGALSSIQVRSLLSQVLQTLQFLHAQKLQLPSGQAKTGFAHGNLTLESLLVAENFYIYVGALSIWEKLFVPSPATFATSTPMQDLVALGYLGFYAWAGRSTDAKGEPLDPRNDQNWSDSDPPLKEFLLQLIGLDSPSVTAEAARQRLLQLPSPETSPIEASPKSTTAPPRKLRKRRLFWIIGLLLLLGLGAILWFTRLHSTPIHQQNFAAFESLVPTFDDVNRVEPGTYPYTSGSTWVDVLNKRPINNLSVRDLLTQPRKTIAAQFNFTSLPQASVVDAIANNQVNFAVINDVTPLPDTIDRVTVAYDGLLVFVPVFKAQNLPNALEGKISVDDLRRIFTGQVTRWRDINSNLPDLAIKPYRPIEPEALQLFQQKVFNNDQTLIAQFQQIPQRSTIDTLRAIDPDTRSSQQSEAGTIGFGTFVQTWDQCKVYPLALVQGQAQPVQVRLRKSTNGQLVPVTPNDN